VREKIQESLSQNRTEPSGRRLTLLGIRMTPDRMIEVKVEAARRGMSVATLFEDLWARYVSMRKP
jgi:hypothetical protein